MKTSPAISHWRPIEELKDEYPNCTWIITQAMIGGGRCYDTWSYHEKNWQDSDGDPVCWRRVIESTHASHFAIVNPPEGDIEIPSKADRIEELEAALSEEKKRRQDMINDIRGSSLGT